MTNLTEQDLKRIETIEGYLRQLDMCNPEYSLPQFKPYQPIDTTEGEQEQGKEWKVGEWVKDEMGNCGLVIEILKNGDLRVDNQSPYGGLITIGTIYVYQPSPEEIQAHLVEIAEKKYPVGAKVKFGKFTKEISVPICFKYKYGNLECADFEYWTPTKGWAELAPIETEQRWMPEKGEDYWLVLGYCNVEQTTHDFWNEKYVEVGNCFKTEQEAQKAAEAIKQYLSTNKF